MTDHEISEFLKWRVGSPYAHTIGQIQATLRDHGGCVLYFEDGRRSSRYVLGRRVEETADTVVHVNHRTL